ncbi:transcriptional regulator [Pullulanibacillus camelliae]|uniref:Transcriptional regulator n=1 Tax=Pullulanibacillus camelliae TaxID=1707096 RepID=A0A8J2VDR7_9BACL|nr:sugar diacid recognition domain-containing protein [Pullulanibacillus camelliae]GGE27889.1 transcriptional regulator [Pullulanibacillus camelliae]
MLSKAIAGQIVDKIIQDLGFNINIMNRSGEIIASGDKERIGTIHEGAVRVLETGAALTIQNETYTGAKPGVNLPIAFNGRIVGVVGITGNPKTTAKFGALVVSMTELMLEQFSLLEESDWRARTKGFMIDECLKADPDIQKIYHKAKQLKIKLEPPFRVIVLQIKQPIQASSSNLYYRLADRLTAFQDLYHFVDDEHFLLLTKASTCDQAILKKIKPLFEETYKTVRVGIAEPHDHIKQTHERYRRVVKGFELTEGSLFHTDELRMLYLLDSTHAIERDAYITQTLGTLSDELRTTLTVFFDHNLNISQAAQALFIHRNTLIYRLDKITEMTKLDPRHFSDAWALGLAFWLNCTKNKQ